MRKLLLTISFRGATAICTIMALLFAAGLLADTPVVARDRPGTPNEVEVLLPPVNYYAKRPILLVTFHNTASEDVSFWVEWTANGEPRPPSFGPEFIECPVREATTYWCARDFLRVERGGKLQALSQTDQRDVPFAFYVSDVDFGIDYCFRLMAQDTDGVISETWSGWACRKTPPMPEPPEKPQITHVTLLPGRTGEGEIGGPVPNRVLVEWADESERAGHYVVQELFENSRWGTISGEVVRKSEPWEAAVDVKVLPTMEQPARYRVCAVNIAGETCSDSVSSKTYAADEQIDPDLVVKPREPAADTRLPSDAVVKPAEPAADTRLPSDAVVAPTPHRADTLRRGPYSVPVIPPGDPR